MDGFLLQACQAARERVASSSSHRSLAAVRTAAAERVPAPSFSAALASPGVSVIAEVKRASPSRGPLAPITDVGGLVAAYQAGGAAAVSVLTEPQWFRGSLGDLARAGAASDLPLLRKDFIVDPYQVFEARAAGAAAVLLILAALSDDQADELLGVVAEAGLDALLEVRDPVEARRAVEAAARADTKRHAVIGVNARDLGTLEVDPDRFGTVVDALGDRESGPRVLTVAESGVRGPEDVSRLGALGADAVLVGESVVKAADPAAAVATLVAAGLPAAAQGAPAQGAA